MNNGEVFPSEFLPIKISSVKIRKDAERADDRIFESLISNRAEFQFMHPDDGRGINNEFLKFMIEGGPFGRIRLDHGLVHQFVRFRG